MVNPADAEQHGFEDGELIRVSSRRGSVTTHIQVTDRVAPGVMFMTFHYQESPVNELTNSAGDPVTKTAEFKVCAVRMEKLAPGEGEQMAAERAAARSARGAAAK